jgi:crotonobetainyl-CoA:carnitine CoA-transferase CaiB-like acyl-CoA transferase
MSGPLAGLRVLDLSRVLAGPWCTQILGDMGAEVLKIERPGLGDDTRQYGPPWLRAAGTEGPSESSYFLSANRSKRSVTLNLATGPGQEIVRRLAAISDILVENFKTGDLASKGLGYEELRVLNPRLIYCSITGFGASGPLAGDPGYDYLIQAQGGLMSLTGLPDGIPGAGPTRVGVAVSDLTTGMNAAIAILAALRHRDRTGEGQYIDLAMLDVQVSWLANQAQAFFATGMAPARTGDQHASIVPYQPFNTRDGQLIVAVGNDAQFRRFCAVLGQDDLGSDPLYATNAARVTNRARLLPLLAQAVAQWTTSALRARLRAEGADVPGSGVRGIF